MYFNESNTRLNDERRKDLRREADRQRLAKTAQQPQHKPIKKNPLWTRVWTLL